MLRYTVKRIVLVVPVVLGVMIIVFFFQSISKADPAAEILGLGASQEDIARKREEMGLNDPIVVQFGRYVWNFVSKGDLGVSYVSGRPIMQELLTRFPITLRLAFSTVLLAIVIGVPLGVLSAVKQYTVVDSGVLAVSVFGISVPNFWLGLMFISLFSVRLRILPALGLKSSLGWVMPIAVGMVTAAANYIRVTRSSMLESIRQDYIRTARAKGLSEYVVVFRHALRNSLIPIINCLCNSLGMQLGGALIIESLFGLPGIGKYAVDAISTRNYPAVLGSVILLATTYTLLNLIVDIIYTVVDPRIKTALFTSRKKNVPTRAALKDGRGANG